MVVLPTVCQLLVGSPSSACWCVPTKHAAAVLVLCMCSVVLSSICFIARFPLGEFQILHKPGAQLCQFSFCGNLELPKKTTYVWNLSYFSLSPLLVRLLLLSLLLAERWYISHKTTSVVQIPPGVPKTSLYPSAGCPCFSPTMMAFRAAAPRVLDIGRHSWLGRSAVSAMGDSMSAPFSSSLQRSPHVVLEEKGLLVERLLVAKVRNNNKIQQ